jgi:hypothetical protein
MKKILLKIFSTKELWREILNREGFQEPTRQVDTSELWSEVYYKNPLLIEFLKKREIDLLKRSTIGDVSTDFILGQIAENRLWQSFSNIVNPIPKVEGIGKEEEKQINKNDFLSRWNK